MTQQSILQGEKRSGGWRRRPKRDVGRALVGEGCGVDAAGGAEGAVGDDDTGDEVEEGREGETGELEDGAGEADITGGKNGFRRSTETVQGLPDFNKINVLSPLCST